MAEIRVIPDDDGPKWGRRESYTIPRLPWIRLLMVLVIAIAFLVFLATGQAGFVEIRDTQAAVIVNYLTGDRDVLITPGYRFFIPFIQQAFVFDKSPQEFVMQGERDIDAGHVAKLTVRANDGSNFWFDELKIQYELIPDQAGFVLQDSGAGETFKLNWVRAYARAILRDEFGRFTAVEVADPTSFKIATVDATTRMNERLEPHGVHIIQIITPRAKFEERYEKAIEDRKVADQEVEKLKIKADQLLKERDRRLAEIESKRAVEYEVLKGELEGRRIDAERDLVRAEKTADAYRATKRGEGTSQKVAQVEEARGLVEKSRKEAEGLRAITAALEKGGETLLREELAKLLSRVEFELVPYSKDPAPTRIELTSNPPAQGDSR